jgi:hypothetical protein
MSANSKRGLEHVTFSTKSVSRLLTDEQKQRNFWPLTTWLWLSTLLIYLVIYSHFHEWNQSYKVTDSSCPRNYWHLTRDNKMSIPAVLLTAAKTLHKLKQKMRKKKGNCIFLYWLRPGTFGYALMCQILSPKTLSNHIKTKHYNVWCLFLNLLNDTSSAVYVYDTKWL